MLSLSLSPILNGFILTSFTLSVFSTGHNQYYWHTLLHSKILLRQLLPLSSRRARTTPSAPWLSDVLREHRSKLRAAERKWHKSKNSTNLSVYQSLLSSFSANAKTTYYHNKMNNCSEENFLFSSLLFSSLLFLPLLLHQLIQLMTLQFSSQIKQEPSVTNSSHHKLMITS